MLFCPGVHVGCIFTVSILILSTPASDCKEVSCCCINEDNCTNSTCETDGQCYSQMIGTIKKAGCIDRHSLGLCSSGKVCCNGSFCNKNTTGTLLPTTTTTSASNEQPLPEIIWIIQYILTPILAVAVCLFLSVFICFCCIKWCKRRHSRRRPWIDAVESGSSTVNGKVPPPKVMMNRECPEAIIPKGNSLSCMREQAKGRNADGQLSVLLQRTIVRRSHLMQHLHSGAFSEIYKGQWRDDVVAIKVFSSQHQYAWFKEIGIYQSVDIHHEHILSFIAADSRQDKRSFDYCLVTEYHDQGDLRYFLQENSLQPPSALKMCWSIASGLAHLHDYNLNKPSIAHRNLSSQHVLVKANGECCIADLGSAVVLKPNILQLVNDITVFHQELRYRPPELLDAKDYQAEGFDAHLRGDVYSLGLILWEICRRCEMDGQFYEAKLPYEEELSPTCSIAEARDYLYVHQNRPEIPELWGDHEVLSLVSGTIRDCWCSLALSRPSSKSVCDVLRNILGNYCPKLDNSESVYKSPVEGHLLCDEKKS